MYSDLIDAGVQAQGSSPGVHGIRQGQVRGEHVAGNEQ